MSDHSFTSTDPSGGHTTLPPPGSNQACPCGKKSAGRVKVFGKCCGQFLSGNTFAKTPEQLMRSRFTAYYLGGYGQYLLDTWFPATAQNLTVTMLSRRDVQWRRLEIIDKSQEGDQGIVEFTAFFLGDDGEEAMHERSNFSRVKGRWFYVGGEVNG